VTSGARHAVFLDRDGTLIESDLVDGRPVPFHDPADMRVLGGVLEGCARLKAADYLLVMVTNQPDIARGTVSGTVIATMNTRIVEELGLDLGLTCAHDDADECDCRKPKPGLLQDGAKILDIDLDHASFMVGDRWRDIDAGHNAGVTTVLIDRGYDERLRAQPDHVTTTFSAAVEWILQQSGLKGAS
jgi:D-glycero-D-manno-heptose 1,7-bisphosphate phosphatase